MARVTSGRGTSKQDYATPPEFIDRFQEAFGPIGFDLAASPHNKKHAMYYGKGSVIATDSLSRTWWKECPSNAWSWLNPPFSDIAPWAKKCAEESKHGVFIPLLVPAAVGSNWFRDHVFNRSAVYFLNGRIPFDHEKPKWDYPKDCLLALYGWKPGIAVWDWKRGKAGFHSARLLFLLLPVLRPFDAEEGHREHSLPGPRRRLL